MFNKRIPLRVIASLLAVFMALPAAAQTVFAAADDEITVIIEMNTEPLFASNSAMQLNEEQQELYSKRTEAQRDKTIARAEKSVGSLEVKYTYSDVFNGAAVTIRESELEKLQSVYGVAKVYDSVKVKLAVDNIDDEYLEAFNEKAKEMINLASAREQGYEGEGMLIAVIDGGFETKHENFQKIDGSDNKLSRSDVADTVSSGVLSSSAIKASAYVNSKIPYYYNYALAGNNGEPLDWAEPDHGTHVAGIAAGNGSVIEGVAPKAQLALLQVSFESNEAFLSDVLAAINDAVALGADAMNMSIGENWVDASFGSHAPIATAIENARNAGCFVACAAGNEGYLGVGADDPHYATDCFPSTAPGATAVGAANSDPISYMSDASFSFGGKSYDCFLVGDGVAVGGSYAISEPLKAGTIRAGLTLTFRGGQYADKFVPVVKGAPGFTMERLADHLGRLYSTAAGCLMSRSFYDEIEEDLFWYTYFTSIVPILVLEDEDFDKAIAAGSVTVTEGAPDPMAYFSTWGFDRDLQNGVDISAPGTDIYSSVTDNNYAYMGGTSMATPFVCGASALMGEMLNDTKSGLTGGERVKYIENALKNSAALMVERNSGEYLSPRLQGAGLMNIGAALQNKAVLTDALRSGEAALSLGTALSDKFSFSFKLMNDSDTDKTYDVSACFTTDSYGHYEENEITDNYIQPNDRIALDATVTGLEKSVAVRAGGSVIIDVDVALDPEQTAALSEIFTNGFYVDGFLVAEGDGETLSIPLTGFYGDYYDVPAVTDVMVDYSVDEDDGIRLYVYADSTISLSKVEVTVTNEGGDVIWNNTFTDSAFDGFFYMSFSFDDEEEPIYGMTEGNYAVKLKVLPAAKGAKEQTFEDEFYFPGIADPDVISWELIPDGDGYTVRVLSGRKDLDYVEFTGVTFKALGHSDWTYLELEEETEEGFVYTGYVYMEQIRDPKANYDTVFTNVIGRTQTFAAPVSGATRILVQMIDNIRSFFLTLIARMLGLY